MRFLVTGGAGFIGSAFIRFLITNTDHSVLNYDKLTYAGTLASLLNVSQDLRYQFVKGDICDANNVRRIFDTFQPDIVMHFAAESHVDRSIEGPATFVKTNVVGTAVLLDCALAYWKNSTVGSKFRFHHISTDEVFGSLDDEGFFTEQTAYNPSSPYSASKAGSDHLVRAWHHTFGLPTLITNCSNNYGPCQFPEKLIPLVILNAIDGKPLPIYGNGLQIRDWLYVEDHVRALYQVITRGNIGETYNIGGHNEKTNLDVVEQICELLDEMWPDHPTGVVSYRDLIKFVEDRPGHDQRYAINSGKIQRDLGWVPLESFETGLKKTIMWYLENAEWCQQVQRGMQGQQSYVNGNNRTVMSK